MSYQHILLVTDLQPDAGIVAQKARDICTRQRDARLSVLHIVQDTIIGFGYEMVPAASIYSSIDTEKCETAKVQMAKFLKRNALNADSQEVSTAISNSEGIINYCDTHDVDLVIIGRHERHGLSAWINKATADSIMPNIACDILVVRLDTPSKQTSTLFKPLPV